MPTRNIVLTDRQADLIESLVASGRYQNASEVLREGVRLVEQREAEDRARVEALRSAIAAGDADIAAGRSKVFKGAALKRHIRSLTRSALIEASGRRK
ncbi:MAG: type II toxin-antitoxin system ParD family antitoxin [Micropepsaceae bacterium]